MSVRKCLGLELNMGHSVDGDDRVKAVGGYHRYVCVRLLGR